MKHRWILSTFICSTLVALTDLTYYKGDWVGVGINAPLAIWWFFTAHNTWEKGNPPE